VIRRKVIEMLEKRGIPFTPEGFAQTVSDGDRRDIRLFLKTDMPVTIRNSRGVPLLNLAVRNGHRAVIPLLLSRGADIDAVSQDRENTALMDAAARGDQDIISDLLEAGAKTDFQSKNGQTALVLAIGGGFIDAPNCSSGRERTPRSRTSWAWMR
jgi:ankyrin repeat protein